MQVEILRANLTKPRSRQEVIREYCTGKRVLDIGCVHHDIENSKLDGWLHGIVVACAEHAVGVDYLESEIAELSAKGFDVISADVTKPIVVDGQFDVIVVGNLIEHLSNFEGLMDNIRRLLRPEGVALISTANPFYREQYFFSAFKNDILINPEHTCWLDPVALDQLCARFGLVTAEVRWVEERWPISAAILHGERQKINMFTGRWDFYGEASAAERLMGPPLKLLLSLLPADRKERIARRYGQDLGRFLYLKMKAFLFEIFWRIYRLVLITSDLNKHELFISVIERKGLINTSENVRKK